MPVTARLPCCLAVGAPVSYRHALSLLREMQLVQGNLRSHWGGFSQSLNTRENLRSQTCNRAGLGKPKRATPFASDGDTLCTKSQSSSACGAPAWPVAVPLKSKLAPTPCWRRAPCRRRSLLTWMGVAVGGCRVRMWIGWYACSDRMQAWAYGTAGTRQLCFRLATPPR